MSRTFTHLTGVDREMIQSFQLAGMTLRAMARKLGRAASSLLRELKRNTGGDGMYRSGPAHTLARKRARQPRRALLLGRPEAEAALREELERLWSPDQIAGRRKWAGLDTASRSTIYRYLVERPEWRRWLRGPTRARMRNKQRERIHGVRPLSQRPEAVARRERLGDWEGDTVRGPKSTSACVVTLVERKSRYLMARLLPDGAASSLNRAVKWLLQDQQVHTLTVDRGMEFASFRKLEEALGIPIYFCDPQKPWQRGQNEYFNRELRTYFPRGTDFDGVSRIALARAIRELNDRPRKCLNYRTAKEVQEIEMLHLK